MELVFLTGEEAVAPFRSPGRLGRQVLDVTRIDSDVLPAQILTQPASPALRQERTAKGIATAGKFFSATSDVIHFSQIVRTHYLIRTLSQTNISIKDRLEDGKLID